MKMISNNDKKTKNSNKHHRLASYQRRSTSITVLSETDDADDAEDEHDDNDIVGSSSSINDFSASFFYEGRPTPQDFEVEWVLDNTTNDKNNRNNDNDSSVNDDDPELPCCSTSDTDEDSDEEINNGAAYGDGTYGYDYDYDYENIKRRVHENMNRRRTRRPTRLLVLKIAIVCVGIAVVAVPLGLICTRDKRNAASASDRGKSADAVTTFDDNNIEDDDILAVDTSLSGDFMDEEETDDGGDSDEEADVVTDTSDLEQDNVDDSTTTTTTSLTASPTNAPPTSSPLTETVTPATPAPVPPPSSPPTLSSQSGASVIVGSNQFLERGEFHSSPSGRYKVGLTPDDGQLVLIKTGDRNDAETVVWSSGITGGFKCFVQADGNVIVRDSNQNAKWSTETHGNPGAELVVTDQGQIALVDQSTDTAIWLQGVPRSTYQGPSSDDMTFPIRGAFYYPWYPQTWFIGGNRAHYISSMGMYSSSDPDVAKFHVEAMDYSHIDLSIASWWGPNTHLDRARITMLMDETLRQQSPLKWTVYHEVERDRNQTVEELKSDLDYLKYWYAWHPAWAHKNGLPVIFVYNEKGCDVARRWKQASQGEWYVVLKIFPKATECEFQPDSWHQYGVGRVDGTIHNPGHSYVLSPGFWRADKDVPMVPRVDAPTFCENTKRMVQSNEQWQLIVSFSEAGEGTMIEPSPDWESSSGYGSYLDCLHNNF